MIKYYETKKIDNLVLAFTNLYGISTIYAALELGLQNEANFIGLFMIFSILYHLAEHSTHHMPGFCGMRYEKILWYLNKIAATLVIAFFIWKYKFLLFQGATGVFILGSLLATIISELSSSFGWKPDDERIFYMLFHGLGHIMALHFPLALWNAA